MFFFPPRKKPPRTHRDDQGTAPGPQLGPAPLAPAEESEAVIPWGKAESADAWDLTHGWETIGKP